jgi:predicted amidohydrolase
MPKKPIISVAQIKYYDIDKKHNVEKIKKYIRLAKAKNSDIVCFPEVCITKQKNVPFDNEMLRQIRDECKKNEIWCIVSDELIIGKKEYNVAILIDRKGRIKGHYRKINLYSEKLTPGKKVKVFDTDFGKIGIVICWDLAFPELFMKMKKLGAEIVFCPAWWWYEPWAHKKLHKEGERKLLKSLIKTRAFENLFYVALCNPVTNEKYMVSYSAIASPHHVLKDIFGKEGMITAELDLSEIRKFRRLYPGKKLPS